MIWKSSYLRNAISEAGTAWSAEGWRCAINAVMEAMNINLSSQPLQEFQEQTTKDAQAITN